VTQNSDIMIRKFIVVFVLILAFYFSGYSQQKPFQFGIKVAPNISWLKPATDGYENNGNGFGFSWGFIADFALTENYFVSTGFNAVWNNSSLKYPHKAEDHEGVLYRDYRLRYIEIPIKLKMKTNKLNDHLKAYGQLGLGSAFKIGAKAKDTFEYTEDGVTKTTPEDENNISDEIQLFKASLIVGGGVEYYIDESTLIFVEFNYNNGFTNVLKDYNTIDGTLSQQAQLHYIELAIGVIF